jgi:hypothetical protein
MIYLKGNKTHDLFDRIQEKLNSLSLSYKTLETDETPYLMEDDKEIKGEKEVFSFLDNLSNDLKSWYYC